MRKSALLSFDRLKFKGSVLKTQCKIIGNDELLYTGNHRKVLTRTICPVEISMLELTGSSLLKHTKIYICEP